MKINFTKLTYGFFYACAMAGITYLGVAKYYEKEIAFGENYGSVIQAVKDVEDHFYHDADRDDMTRNMVGGLINGLNDRYTSCLDANSSIENNVNFSAQLQTAGFCITYDDYSDNILINNVEPNSQAEKMGLCRGDLILSIDGVSVREAGYYNIIGSLVGKSNTSVELLVDHNGEQRYLTYVREKDIESSKEVGSELLDKGIFYYRFNQFDLNSANSFSYELDSMMAKNDISGLIIDLRKNSGGKTDEAVKFFDFFAPAGNQIMAEEVKTGKKIFYCTSNDIKYKDMKVVVLVSEKSLSSSEVLAAFFKDTGLGTVVGTQTGGKGVFQMKRSFNDFYHYNIVAGYYYVNNLPNYNGVGITPDVVVDMDPKLIGTDDDIQLKKALEILS